MEIRMYECGFGDCFRLRRKNDTDLYVDFGIHNSSWSSEERKNRFMYIINDMENEKNFLLSHYHDDHYNGAIYMAKNTKHKFRDVYVPDVWNMPESVHITSLMLLRDIFTKSIICGENTIIDFFESICTNRSTIYFLSRGSKFHKNQYLVLWPEKGYVADKAEKIFTKMQEEMSNVHIEQIQMIASRLNELILQAGKTDFGENMKNYSGQFSELEEQYVDLKYQIESGYNNKFKNKMQYKLTRFGNEISIVFQNCSGDKNVLFTGDFGKKINWSYIEDNKDNVVEMKDKYNIIKVPHHGTKPYYHSFVNRVRDDSIFLITNGNSRKNWCISEKYFQDSIYLHNHMICSVNMTLSHKCKEIYPGKYVDV